MDEAYAFRFGLNSNS